MLYYPMITAVAEDRLEEARQRAARFRRVRQAKEASRHAPRLRISQMVPAMRTPHEPRSQAPSVS